VELLRTQDIRKYFPVSRYSLFRGRGLFVRAVDGVSFTIEKGRSLGLIGESGSGKTTTGYIVAGLERPTSGRVIFAGRDITNGVPRELRGKIQIVFQDPRSSFNPRIKVLDSIAEPLKLLKGGELSRKEIYDLALSVAESTGLDYNVVNKYPHELSGGQIQRAAIARAIITNPELVVLDEPTSALDVSLRSQIINLLLQVQQERGISYLVISHDIFTVGYMSDTIAVMYAGKIAEEAPVHTILNEARHPYTLALITSIPIPNPRLRGRRRIILSGEPPNLIKPPEGCRFHPRCPFATDVCRRDEPRLVEVERGHKVACHNLDKVIKMLE